MAQYASTFDDSTVQNVVEIAAVCVVLGYLLINSILLPTARRIMLNKRDVLNFLHGMSQNIITSIQTDIANRLETIHGRTKEAEAVETRQTRTTKAKAMQKQPSKKAMSAEDDNAQQNRADRFMSQIRTGVKDILTRVTSNDFIITMRVNIINVVQIIFFSLITIENLSNSHVQQEIPMNQFLCGAQQSLSHLTIHYIRMMADGVVIGGDERNSAVNINSTSEIINQLLTDHQVMMYGGFGILGLLGREDLSAPANRLQFELFMKEACTSYPDSDQTECYAFRGGVFARGLHSAIVDFIEQSGGEAQYVSAIVEPTFSAYPAYSGVWSATQAAAPYLATSKFLSLARMDDEFMVVPIRRSSELFSQFENDELAGSEVRQKWILIGFLTAILAIQGVVVRPLIKNLDNEGKRTRMLLLLIPENRLESIREKLFDKFGH